MADPEVLAPLVAALRALDDWLQAQRVPGIVIGGVAASLLGRPRATRDVDAVILVPEGRWSEVLAAAPGFGLDPRLPDALEFAQRSRVFLLRHRRSGIDVDVAIGSLPFEKEAIERLVYVEAGGLRVPVPRPEDLLVMKAVAHRPRDMADIESLLDAHPHLDLDRARRWLEEFAEALDQPEILGDVEAMIAGRRLNPQSM